MVCKLALFALVALTTGGLAAGSAFADTGVLVENPGVNEAEAENTIAVVEDVFGSHVTLLQCNLHVEGVLSQDGHVDAADIEGSSHSGSVGACDTANDCDDAGFEGQIEEDEATHGFTAHFTACIEGSGLDIDNTQITLECDIGDAEGHCDSPISGFAGLEVEGEVSFHEPLGLMHAD